MACVHGLHACFSPAEWQAVSTERAQHIFKNSKQTDSGGFFWSSIQRREDGKFEIQISNFAEEED